MRKGFAICLLVLCVVAQVSAVSIGKPTNLDVKERIDVGQEEKFTFMLRGDAAPQTIEFFLDGSPSGLLLSMESASGVGTSHVKRTISLGAYEQKFIDVTVGSAKAGTYQVVWGYKSAPVAGSGVGFEQVVQDTFEVRSECKSCFDVNASAGSATGTRTTASSSSGGGGGGGGGGVGPRVSPTINSEGGSGDSGSSGSSGSGGSFVSDVTGGGSATNELVVPVESLPSGLQNVVTEVKEAVAEGSKGGRGVLVLVVALFTFAAMLAGLLLKTAKEEGVV